LIAIGGSTGYSRLMFRPLSLLQMSALQRLRLAGLCCILVWAAVAMAMI
jgi:hypothetical protein